MTWSRAGALTPLYSSVALGDGHTYSSAGAGGLPHLVTFRRRITEPCHELGDMLSPETGPCHREVTG